MAMIIVVLVGGLFAVQTGAQGCDPNPCDQVCTETVDSYICSCYNNWELQADANTCIHKRDQAFDNMIYGCFAEESANRDVEFLVWDRTASADGTIENCVHDCQSRAFKFAALQNGGQCWCTNNVERIHGDSTECTSTCSGEVHQICGGPNANSVYFLTPDTRYMGCYNEDESNTDLDEVMWEKTEVHSPQECIMTCSDAGYSFAGIFDGGRCSCGNEYGSYGVAPDINCTVTCANGWHQQNCGGSSTNAIYRVVRTTDISTSKHGEPELFAQFQASLLTEYPYTSGVISSRFVLYASDVVQAPYEDNACYTDQCYSVCGNIFVPEGISGNSIDITIRQFHIKLSDLPALINPTAERVYVFVQTLVIDQSVTFDYPMYIRARQIIINYDADPLIGFKHDGAQFDFDIAQAVNRGPPSDITMLKMSTSCARMLLNTADELNRRLGYSIFDDMSRDYPYSEEHKTYQDIIRNIQTAYTGLQRYGINFAPYFTKASYERKLEAYYEQLSVYRDQFDSMMAGVDDCQTVLSTAGNMLNIWTDTILNEALVLHAATYDVLVTSQGVYQNLYAEYSASVESTEEARIIFEDGIIDSADQSARQAMLGLCQSSAKMYYGLPPTGAAQTAEDIVAASQGLSEEMVGFAKAMENIAHAVKSIQAMFSLMGDILSGIEDLDATFDWTRYDGVIEMIYTLYFVVEEWDNVAYSVEATLRDPAFSSISGCTEFRMAFADTCRHGEQLLRSAIENAENTRRGIMATAMYLNNVQIQQRYEGYYTAIEADCALAREATFKWAEQNYDVTMAMNHLLITVCQAYFYEEMYSCPSSSIPSFSADMNEVLQRVNAALILVQGMSRASNAVIDVDITDTDTDPNCRDPDLCPVNVLRNLRQFTYTVSSDNPAFAGIDIALVEQVSIYFHGAATSDETNESVSVNIESSGPFINRQDNTLEYFLTRSLSQYAIELYCDLYATGGSTIQHVTPFTTWMIRLSESPNMDHVDLSQVTQITLTFQGSFTMGYSIANL